MLVGLFGGRVYVQILDATHYLRLATPIGTCKVASSVDYSL